LLTAAGVKTSFTCVNRKFPMSEKQFSDFIVGLAPNNIVQLGALI